MNSRFLIHKAKYIFAITASLTFTLAGILFDTKLGWLLTIFFGICSSLFIYMFLNPRKKDTLYALYDEMFLLQDEVGTVQYYNWGFYNSSQKTKFYWNKIHAITAFKRNLITAEEIYLSIEQEFDVLIVSEFSTEWDRFKQEIANRFDTEDPEWFEKMASHAFEDDEIILYKKQMANKSFT
ncbi:hypothetical protein AMR72_04910 [Flavobacterium psychrophilum]|nr:hypothetical protein AMR72_04910 [Flavobacterium psychrophilum]AOE51914.1 hypothetical protein ALW18_04905 [Flavobacterium psychrophilum]